MVEPKKIRASVALNREMFNHGAGKTYAMEELKTKLGSMLIQELLQRNMVKIGTKSRVGWDDLDIVFTLEIGVNGDEIKLQESNFYTWCVNNKPEFLFEYLFTKDIKINEI